MTVRRVFLLRSPETTNEHWQSIAEHLIQHMMANIAPSLPQSSYIDPLSQNLASHMVVSGGEPSKFQILVSICQNVHKDIQTMEMYKVEVKDSSRFSHPTSRHYYVLPNEKLILQSDEVLQDILADKLKRCSYRQSAFVQGDVYECGNGEFIIRMGTLQATNQTKGYILDIEYKPSNNPAECEYIFKEFVKSLISSSPSKNKPVPRSAPLSQMHFASLPSTQQCIYDLILLLKQEKFL